MSTQQYIYAIVPSENPLAGLPDLGVGGKPVRSIDVGPISALVSDLDSSRLRPTRANLSAHHRVTLALTGRTGTLPTPFGTVAEHEDDIAAMLAEHCDDFLEAIDRVHGCVEMTMVVRWDSGPIIDHLVESNANLRAHRDAMLANPTHNAQMNVGRLVESALGELREMIAETVTPTLEPITRELKLDDTREDVELARIACLIEQGENGGDHDAFDTAVESVARTLDDRYILSIAGPFPCQSFIDLEMSAPERAASNAHEEITRVSA